MRSKNDLKKRMESIREIKKMTKAMELVSGVKMKRARAQLSMTLPFFDFCRATMAEIYLQNPGLDHPFFNEHEKKRGEPWIVGYFILTGDKGFAGAYNVNVLNTALDHIHNLIKEMADKGINATPKIYVAGKQGKDFFRDQGFEVVDDFYSPIDSPTYYRARDISDYIHDLYDSGKIDSVYTIYTRIKSAVDIKPVTVKLIPISADDLLRGLEIPDENLQAYEPEKIYMEFVPSADTVMDYLATTYLNGMVYGSLTEAFASEQTTRRSAMKNATDSARDILEGIKSKRQTQRQESITQEVTETINSARAVKD